VATCSHHLDVSSRRCSGAFLFLFISCFPCFVLNGVRTRVKVATPRRSLASTCRDLTAPPQRLQQRLACLWCQRFQCLQQLRNLFTFVCNWCAFCSTLVVRVVVFFVFNITNTVLVVLFRVPPGPFK
jgi:hypothetical protein